MTETATTTETTPAAPSTPTEATTRLAALKADPKWGERLLAGDAAATREFNEVSTLAAQDDDIDRAMAGDVAADGVLADGRLRNLADGANWLRQAGLGEGEVREALTGEQQATPEQVAAVKQWKESAMKSGEFRTKFLSGDPDAVKRMTLANLILSKESER